MSKATDQPLKITTRSSYQKVFKLYYKGMVMFASKYIADTDDVEDLVQETFVALWNNRNQLRSATAIKSYLYTTLRNKSLNFLRNSKSNRSNSDELLRLEADDDFADEIIAAKQLIVDIAQ